MRLIGLCAAALVGLALGDLQPLEPRHVLCAALVALLGACLAWRQRAWRWLALGACAVAAGALRASTLEPMPPSPLGPYTGQLVRLGGRLIEPPSLSGTGASVRLALELDVTPDGSPCGGSTGQLNRSCRLCTKCRRIPERSPSAPSHYAKG